MAAMTFVTLPGQVGPLLGPALGGILVEYASWHWIFLINLPVGVIGAIATLWLMPNYTMQTRRFDLVGFFLLAAGMATLTLALDGQKGLGISSLSLVALVAIGVVSVLWYLWHARDNDRALFSLSLFQNTTYRLGLLGSFAGRIGSGMLPFMTPVFLQIGLGFSPFHAGLMMIPMVLGSMGMKRIVVQVVNRFGYRRVLVTSTLGLALISLLFMAVALLGWYAVLPHAALHERRGHCRRAAAGDVWPAPSERRYRRGPPGLFIHLSQHGGHNRSARVDLRQGSG